MTEFNAPGKVPAALTGTAAHIPKVQEWDPEGDVHIPLYPGAELYAPTIVRAPPQLPRPEQHPHRPEFPPRQYERFFNTTPDQLAHQLAFTASSVRIDNYSSHWVYLQSAGVYVPPFIYGAIVNLSPGVSVAQWVLTPPRGYSDPTPVLDSTIVSIWYEDEVVNSPGVPIQSSFRVGAAGGAVVSGPLLFSPDNTYDIGANGANRPRNAYIAGNLEVGPTNPTSLINPGDMSVARSGAPTNGTIFFGTGAGTYLFFNGSIYQFAGGSVSIPSGSLTAAGGVFPGAQGPNTTGLWAGTGAPAAGMGANGDFYLRSDGGSLTSIYQKRTGAWVGIV